MDVVRSCVFQHKQGGSWLGNHNVGDLTMESNFNVDVSCSLKLVGDEGDLEVTLFVQCKGVGEAVVGSNGNGKTSTLNERQFLVEKKLRRMKSVG